MDHDLHQYPQQQHNGDASFQNPPHGFQAEQQMQVQFAANQMIFRNLFA